MKKAVSDSVLKAAFKFVHGVAGQEVPTFCVAWKFIAMLTRVRYCVTVLSQINMVHIFCFGIYLMSYVRDAHSNANGYHV